MYKSKYNRFIYFTLKQLFLQGVHLGAQLSKTHTNMKRFLLPRTGNISFSIINLQYSIVYFRLSFNLIQHIISKRGVLLVVNENNVVSSTLKQSWKYLNQPISFGEWSSGTLTNFRFILKKTLKTFFVKSRLAQKIKKLTQSNGKLSLKLNNKIRSKFNLNVFLLELRRRIRKLYTLPHVVFVTDTMLSSVVVNEANIVKIPLIGIVDSTNNILDVSYPIPGNSSSIKTLLFYYKLVKLVVLKGMLQEKVKFLRALSNKLNFELKTHQLIKTSKIKKIYPFKKIKGSALDLFFFKKDLSDFFTNAKLYYLFYPNFKKKTFYNNLEHYNSFLKLRVQRSIQNRIHINKNFFFKSLIKLFLNNSLFYKKNSIKIVKSKKINKNKNSTKLLNKNKLLLFLKNFSLNYTFFNQKSNLNFLITNISESLLFSDIVKNYNHLWINALVVSKQLNFYKLIKKNNIYSQLINYNLVKRGLSLQTTCSCSTNKINLLTTFNTGVYDKMLNYVSFIKLKSNYFSRIVKFTGSFKIFHSFDDLKNYNLNNVFLSYKKLLFLNKKKRLHVILNNRQIVNTYLLFYQKNDYFFKKIKRLELNNSFFKSIKKDCLFFLGSQDNSVWNKIILKLVRNYKRLYELKYGVLFDLMSFTVSANLLKKYNNNTPSNLNVIYFKFKDLLKKYQEDVCSFDSSELLPKSKRNLNNKFSKSYKNTKIYNINLSKKKKIQKFPSLNFLKIIKQTVIIPSDKETIIGLFPKKIVNKTMTSSQFSTTFFSFVKERRNSFSTFYNLYGKII